MTALEVFQFEGRQVRTVMVDGEPWFVARDVAAILGYVNPVNAIKQHCRGVAKHHPIVDSLARTQRARVISEPDMLRLIVNSKLPAAAQFEAWVFEDVLPTIRKTGRYGADVDMLAALPSSKLLALAAEAAKRAEAAEAQLAIDAPKARSWDVLADAAGTYTVSDAGKLLASGGAKTGPRQIFGHMADKGWLFKRAGIWTGYQDKINAGLLAEVASSHRHPRTAERVLDAPQVRVTIAGLHALRELFGAAPALDGLAVEAATPGALPERAA